MRQGADGRGRPVRRDRAPETAAPETEAPAEEAAQAEEAAPQTDEAAEVAPEAKESPTQEAPAEKPEKSEKKKTGWLLGGAIAVLVIVIALLVVKIVRDSPDQKRRHRHDRGDGSRCQHRRGRSF